VEGASRDAAAFHSPPYTAGKGTCPARPAQGVRARRSVFTQPASSTPPACSRFRPTGCACRGPPPPARKGQHMTFRAVSSPRQLQN
jgi:hypothetical protein